MLDRPMPRNEEAERALLGYLIRDPGKLSQISTIITGGQEFYVERHGQIFDAMIDLHGQGLTVDGVVIFDALKTKGLEKQCGGLTYLSLLLSEGRYRYQADHYAKIVHDHYLQRQTISCLVESMDKVYTSTEPADLLTEIEGDLGKLHPQEAGKGLVNTNTSLKSTMQHIEAAWDARQRGERLFLGEETGFADLDRTLSGLKAGDLVLLAARPAIGKSTLALNIADNIARRGKIVHFFSLEMSLEQLDLKIISSRLSKSTDRIQSGDIGEEDLPLLAKLSAEMAQANFLKSDTLRTSDQICAFSRQEARVGKKPDIIIVDYLQLLAPHKKRKTETREREVAEISGALKGLAVELECPVLALSQLNRALESRPNKRPMLSDLRESGSLEQDASVVLFLYRDEVYNEDTEDAGIAEVIIAKNRMGGCGTIRLKANLESSRFDALYSDWER